MQSWKVRLGLVLAMLAMLLAVSTPAVADELEFDEFDIEDEIEIEADVGPCNLVSTGDDDGDGLEDEDELDEFDVDLDGLDGEDPLLLVCDVSFDVDGDLDLDDEEDEDDE